METYRANCSFLVKNPDCENKNEYPYLEESFSIVFKAEDHIHAVKNTAKWAKARVESFKEFGVEKISAIKVAKYPIGEIQENGSLKTGGAFHFFEWKYDWMCSLKERIEEFKKNIG